MRLLLPITLASLSGLVGAQTLFEHQYGGTTLDVWMHPHPTVDGEFLVWTAEVGVKIRRFDTATGITTFEQIDDGFDIAGALHGIFISDDLRWGFAVGNDGQAFWATDLSTPSTWHQMDADLVPGNSHIWESFWDSGWEGSVWEREAWIAAEEGNLLHKPAGSNDFSLVTFTTPPPADSHFMCLDFADPDSQNPTLRAGLAGLRTPDQQDQPVPPPSIPAIYWTDDGLTWSPGEVFLAPDWQQGLHYDGDPIFLWGVDFVPGSTTDAYAVGGQHIGNGTGFAWYTEDGGREWYPLFHECNRFSPSGICPPFQPIQPPPAPCTGDTLVQGYWGGLHENDEFATLYDVTALADGSAVATGYAGGLFECPTWKGEWVDRANTHEFGTQPLWGITNEDSGTVNEIWLGGAFGDLRSSIDGGVTWQHEADDVLMRLADISFGSDTDGWVVGQFSRIAKSIDGGVSWEDQYRGAVSPELGGEWRAVHANDQNEVVAVGHTNGVGYTNGGVSQAAIAFTSNGGGTPGNCGWNDTPVLPVIPPFSSLRDVDSYGSGDFWAVGFVTDNAVSLALPIVLHSLDGGASWTQIAGFPPGFEVSGVSALDQNTVVVVGKDQYGKAMAFRTTNASAAMTWDDISPSQAGFTFPPLNAVDVFTKNGILAVGNSGAVLRFKAGLGRLTFFPGVYEQSGPVYGNTRYEEVEIVPGPGLPMIVIAGWKGTVLMFDSNGWRKPHTLTTDIIRGMSFRSQDLGWMTGRCSPPGLGVHTPNGFGDSTVVKFRTN